MAGRRTRSWEEVRRTQPLNERRVSTYVRLMDAEELVAGARYEHGVSDDAIMAALAASEPESVSFEDEDELYLVTLGRYVAALGGTLELRAVFPEGSVIVLREGDQGDGRSR